jgi:hypothetical protein
MMALTPTSSVCRSVGTALICALVVCASPGCGEIFYLPGHNEKNTASPPDVTMRLGERRKVLTFGLNPLDMPPAAEMIRSDDPRIVSVDGPNKSDAYLTANAVGSTRVYYLGGDIAKNRGFEVTVLPPSH